MSGTGVDDEGTGANPGTDERIDFEPSARPDDLFFAVVRTDYLEELLRIHAPVEANAAFLLRAELGLRARSRSEYCYWFEVEIPAGEFEQFRLDADRDLNVDVDALQRAVAETETETVSLHATPDGSVALRNGQRTYALDAETVPLEDPKEDNGDDEELRWVEKLTRGFMASLEFTVEATTLDALVGADDDHDHVGLTVDADAETAEVYFFDEGDDHRTVSLTLGPEDFCAPPADCEDGVVTAERVSVPICRESIDHALGPMRGEVTIVVSEHVEVAVTHFEYTCADGALPVYSCVTHQDGVGEAIESVAPEP